MNKNFYGRLGQRRAVAWAIVIAAILSTTACTSFRGGARIHNYDEANPVEAVPGLLDQSNGDVFIFYVHGMGETEPNFAAQLLGQAERLLSVSVQPDLKIVKCEYSDNCHIVHLVEPVYLRGEAFECKKPADCKKNTFGEVRRFSFETKGRQITLYSYYWDAAADALQRDYNYLDTKVDGRPHWINKAIKDSVVNYGLADATLYTGSFGHVMRQGLEGALCIMLSNALKVPVPSDKACQLAQFADKSSKQDYLKRIKALDLAFIGKSLGSRILIDTLLPLDQVNLLQDRLPEDIELGSPRAADWLDRDEVSDTAVKTIDTKRAIIESTANIFFLANQLPLLGLGQIQANTYNAQLRRDYVYCTYVLRVNEPNCHSSMVTARTSANAMPDLSVYDQSFSNFVSNARGNSRKLTVVAFHDPEDLLGFKAGDHLSGAAKASLNIIEINHRNTPVIAFSFAMPTAAHAREDEHASAADIIWCGGTVATNKKVKAKPCTVVR